MNVLHGGTTKVFNAKAQRAAKYAKRSFTPIFSAFLPALLCVFALRIFLLPTTAHAQEWPQRPIRIVVPFAAGGNTDGIARIVADRLTATLGQQVLVENRPGANGALAAQSVKTSPADGYTLFMAAMPILAILPSIQRVGYDPVRDFAPISNIGTNAFALGVHRSVPATTLKEFVEHVKANPGKLNYASGGSGTVSHLSGALFLKRAGLEMTHVSYKGGAPAVADLLAGTVQMYFGNFSELAPHASGGNIRILGVSSERRSPALPDVPAIAELYPGFRTLTWNGLLAPAGTPPAVVDRVAAEIAKLGKDPDFVARMRPLGVDVVASSPADFAATIQSDIGLWAEAVKIANLKIE
jgi:tripartite-type tricarboxylate transporter receptor subunit TctC